MGSLVITGARGYIGRALAKSLADQGRTLRLVSREVVTANCLPPGATIEHVQADLRDEKSWQALLDGADAVVHLSSRTDLRRAEADPADDQALNVDPVRALIRAAESCRTAVQVVFASSTSIAGHAHINPVSENTPDCPSSVYDRHKLECETILAHATRRGIVRGCSLRLATVYGYGDRVDSVNSNRGVLNAMIRRAMHGQPLTLYGEGSYIRDFTHLSDVCNAFRLALAKPEICDGRHYIVSTGRGYTLAEAFQCVAREAYRATGIKVEVRHVPEPADLHPIERRDFVGDPTLFKNLTDWRPQFDLKYGVRDYFQRLLAHESLHQPANKSSADHRFANKRLGDHTT
jgi:nucleoside-diphosphate-sugar epimerase